MKENSDIRKLAMRHGVKQWQIAAECDISEQTLVRWLRFPLSSERRSMIIAAIERLAQEVV